MTIAFAGLSHLGIVSSLAAAAKGLPIVGYDPDAARSTALRHGQLPVVEPGLPELLQRHGGAIEWTTDSSALNRCEVIVISSDVPTRVDNTSDLAGIHVLIATAANAAAPGTTLVILSQVPPGFARQAQADVTRVHPAKDIQVCTQVETLVFGNAVPRALTPERFIVGCREPLAPLPSAYQLWLERYACPILRMRYESAELAKIAVNMFLVSSVSTTNTLAELCEAIGAQWRDIVPALTSDRRIGPHAYLQPGLGIAGGNLERDLTTFAALAREHRTDAGLIDAWLANSRRRREWALQTLRAELPPGQSSPIIAVWGLAYKPDTATLKNAPSLALLESLHNSTVRAYDPQARLEPGRFVHVTQVASPMEACEEADALIVMTPWREFATIAVTRLREVMRGRLIIDPFGSLDHAHCAASGFRYRRLGDPGATGRLPAEVDESGLLRAGKHV